MRNKVAHVSTMTRWGGVEKMLNDLLIHAHPSNFSHSLLATSSTAEVLASAVQSNVDIFQLKRSFRYDPTALFQMARWLRNQNVDIVHGYNSPTSVWAGIAAFLAETPTFIGGEHGTIWTIDGLSARLTKWAYRHSHKVIVNSEATKLMLNYRFNIPMNKLCVVRNAIDQPTAEPATRTENPFASPSELVVGSVGRLASPKNFGLLIDAAEIVLHQNKKVRFVLIGGGEQEKILRQKIQQAGIQENFFMTGWQDNAVHLIQHFDIFVSSSLHESFGNALIEASLMGKPVIAPQVDGIPEAVLDGRTGILLLPDRPIDNGYFNDNKLPHNVVLNGRVAPPQMVSPGKMAEAILALADNPQLRHRLGTAGREYATQFSLENYQKNLEAVYADFV